MGFIIGGVEVYSWQIFVILGFILGFLEVFVPGFFMLPIGIAMILTAPFTFFFDSMTAQLLIFAIILALVFTAFDKWVKPKLHKKRFPSNVSSMVGKVVMVEEAINDDKETGSIKLYGDHWRAVTTSGDLIDQGKKVEIIGIDGNKVVVKAIS